MIKKAILLISMLTFGSANGQTYSAAVERQSRCETAGELAKHHHGISDEEFRKAVAAIQRKEKSKEISKKLSAETQYIIWLGNSARDQTDAYMKAWAWCMDQK